MRKLVHLLTRNYYAHVCLSSSKVVVDACDITAYRSNECIYQTRESVLSFGAI